MISLRLELYLNDQRNVFQRPKNELTLKAEIFTIKLKIEKNETPRPLKYNYLTLVLITAFNIYNNNLKAYFEH